MPRDRLPDDPAFVARLTALRKELGWSLKKTADYLELSLWGLQKYEKGKTIPPAVMREGILARLEHARRVEGSKRKEG